MGRLTKKLGIADRLSGLVSVHRSIPGLKCGADANTVAACQALLAMHEAQTLQLRSLGKHQVRSVKYVSFLHSGTRPFVLCAIASLLLSSTDWNNIATMAYHNPQQSYWGPTENIHLKPAPYAQHTSLSSMTSLGGASDSYYNPVNPAPYTAANLSLVTTQDASLKKRIRILRLVSRILSLILSGATLAPITMTLVKYFQTRDQYFVVDGQSRTAWASGTIAWYTYMYFGVSAVSFVFDVAILISYCRGTKNANQTAKYAAYWSGFLTGAHVVVWAIAVGIYRYGKIPQDGKFRDLWGWSCSEAANEIQEQVTNVDYSQYCSIQVCSIFTRGAVGLKTNGADRGYRQPHSLRGSRILLQDCLVR